MHRLLTRRAILGCLALAPLTKVEAQLPGLGATEVTQLLNYGQLVGQVANQVRQISLALQTFNQIVIAGRQLTNMQWSNVQSDLANLAGIVQIGQNLAYSAGNLDRIFTTAYPGFSAPGGPYSQRYAVWSQTALDSIRGSVRGSGVTYQQIQNQQLYLSYLRSQNNSSIGQMQAIQTGNQVAIEQVESLRRLQQLMLDDMQAKQAFAAYQVQKDMGTRQFQQNFYAPTRAGRDGVGF